jgi:hypothetical protein
MLELKLDHEDVIILVNLITDKIHELHHEISHTERSEYRQMLKAHEARLKNILQKLEQVKAQLIAA